MVILKQRLMDYLEQEQYLQKEGLQTLIQNFLKTEPNSLHLRKDTIIGAKVGMVGLALAVP